MNYQKLKQMFSGYDAYLVGGAARLLLKNQKDEGELDTLNESPRDWDVLTTQEPPTFDSPWTTTSFGGYRYPELNIDVWQGDIGKFLREVPRSMDGIAIHLATGAVLHTREFYEGPALITTRPVKTRTKSKEG